MRHFHVTATFEVSDNEFERATALAKVKPALDTFEAALIEAAHPHGVTITHGLVPVKRPGPATGKPRGRPRKTSAVDATTQAASDVRADTPEELPEPMGTMPEPPTEATNEPPASKRRPKHTIDVSAAHPE